MGDLINGWVWFNPEAAYPDATQLDTIKLQPYFDNICTTNTKRKTHQYEVELFKYVDILVNET